jgi:hypothetical protein
MIFACPLRWPLFFETPPETSSVATDKFQLQLGSYINSTINHIHRYNFVYIYIQILQILCFLSRMFSWSFSTPTSLTTQMIFNVFNRENVNLVNFWEYNVRKFRCLQLPEPWDVVDCCCPKKQTSKQNDCAGSMLTYQAPVLQIAGLRTRPRTRTQRFLGARKTKDWIYRGLLMILWDLLNIQCGQWGFKY